MAVDVGQRNASMDEVLRRASENWAANLRVAMPGIIHSFDPATQTVTVQLAIKENIIDEKLNISPVSFPLLPDVPIFMPRAGGYCLTMPIKRLDECLVVFGDMCIDGWWKSGGVQPQLEKRRHNLSDAFAIMGIWSQPRKISNYSTTAAQLRSEDGNSYISLTGTEIDIVSPTVKINGIPFSTHKHSGVQPGSGNTGGPL